MAVNEINEYIDSQMEKIILNAGISLAKGDGLGFEDTARLYILHELKDSLTYIKNVGELLKHHIAMTRENIDMAEDSHDRDYQEIALTILTDMQNKLH